MTAPVGLGLARVTVATPKRRVDVALPENALVAELLPHLLRHAGDDLADDGERHGGWTLRRATGAELDPVRSLAVQGVRDGELLNLVPRRMDWPELAYDDIVEVIASGARRSGRSWGSAATRRCGLAVAAVVLVLGLSEVLLSGPSWALPAGCALAVAAVLALIGIVLSRAISDAVAGGVVAGAALPYAFVGGLLLTAPGDLALTRLGAPQLLLGSAALTVFGVLGYAGAAATLRVFIAGIGTGLAGMLAALLCFAGMSPAGAAAVTITVVLGMLPGYPLIAGWLGKLPVPALPDRPEDILEDRPTPRREGVFAAVARATELLSGMLLVAAVVSVCCAAVLVLGGSVVDQLLIVTAAGALLLRGRLFPTPQQRIPLMCSGILLLTLTMLRLSLHTSNTGVRLLLLAVIAAVAGLVLAAGMVYSRRSPSPYIGRIADIVDVLAIMALVPLACAVAGVFHTIQGLFASVGG
ncbi:type VII secretion integral membrane protein EccD [Rugosimonospora africana]|uniref:Type VII secretion integral membrane protein EccD n=1 Tax=Rugosimonospora africana TaxID=556532 RepID=A0A8J3VWY3_9ACTN|nr:type VII secretion integral membrane protein EccD [Rugosimonospora africana]GIH21326.1 type VII secretion integral membrane protein EccD [Rugosimonospora africana]